MTAADRVELYSHVPPPGDNIPVTVTPADIDDSVPTEDKISEAVKQLRRNRAVGPSGIHAEHLKGWLAAAKRGHMADEKGEEKTEAEEDGRELWGNWYILHRRSFGRESWRKKPRGRPGFSYQKGRGGTGGFGWWMSLGRSWR